MLRTLLIALLAVAAGAAERPLSLHPDNPHYFLFRGKPTLLITSGEHYGAVINQDSDYVRYLDTLSRSGLNLTRTFVGSYVEVPGSFKITGNTLAPRPERFLAAWPRAGEKFDLSKPNEALLARLKNFVGEAGKRGIVVEVNLFTPMYEDSLWDVNPMNARNNVNGIGDVPRTELFTLKDEKLTAVEDAMVRSIVAALRDFDNVYYEVCNEPYFGGITPEWHRHIAKTIADAEAGFAARHLISQNFANGSKVIDEPDPRISIFNFHYSFPPESVAMNYGLERVIGNNETGFDGTGEAIYRVQAWDFVLAGGGLFNNLDYSFTAGHEDGTFGPLPADQPGSGTPALRAEYRILGDFMRRLDFIHMAPAPAVVKSVGPKPASARVLSKPGELYAVYIHHAEIKSGEAPGKCVIAGGERRATLELDLPPGSYRAVWVDTKTGAETGKLKFRHRGGVKSLESPAHSEDIALRLAVRR
jgi:hypothetical protein